MISTNSSDHFKRKDLSILLVRNKIDLINQNTKLLKDLESRIIRNFCY